MTGDISKRQEYLRQLRRVLPPDPAWEAWLARTGELPPDFDQLPSHGRLPDLLTGDDGAPITTVQEWQARRERIRQLLQQWVVGSIPPAPDHVRAEALEEQRDAATGAITRAVRLHFGPDERATLRLWLFIPATRDGGKSPVFLTQASHRDWARIALRRGYLACVYAGADGLDDSDTFADAWPGYDWSRLMRRAWAGSRCIDYLAGLPQTDMQHIAITGHSRNGKQALMAAAFDERISLVISSSSGAGGALSARDFSEQHFGEGIELLTRRFPDWFHPRLRFFTGREDRLPVDLPDMVALCAPRPCLLSSAFNDAVESAWAVQQTWRALQPVYGLYGAQALAGLRILWRPGGHETWTSIIERYLDWCDTHFGRARYEFPERLLYPQDRHIEQATTPAPARTSAARTRLDEWQRERLDLRAQINWMLGDAPAEVASPGGGYGEEPPYIAAQMGRGDPGAGVEKQQVMFGEYLCGDVYLPAGARQSGRPLPAVLWLHPWSPAGGYAAYYRRGEQIQHVLAREGYAVFCFDQIGCGRRIEEAEAFYRRHPDWSLLGKQVRDAAAALDALSRLPYIDAARLYGLGYGVGSLAGLHLGALDERLAGLAAVCSPAPLRLDAAQARRWSLELMLLPRLGHYRTQPERVTYDIGDLMAGFAPRPLLIVSPLLDREAPPQRVTPAVEAARQVYGLYGAADRLVQATPEDYNHFGPPMLRIALNWLRQLP